MLLRLRRGLTGQFCLQDRGPIGIKLDLWSIRRIRPYHVTNLYWIGQVIGVGFCRIRINEKDDALDLELVEHLFMY